MEDLRKHLRNTEADFDPVHLAHTIHTLVSLSYELASKDIPFSDTREWKKQINKLCAVTYSAEILALVASRWLDQYMVDIEQD